MPLNRIPWLTALLSLTALLLFILQGPAPVALIYHYDTLIAQPWRGLSAHWVHSDLAHLGWNLAAFALLGSLLERGRRIQLISALLIGSLTVTLWLAWQLPHIRFYCGLSGVLNTLWVLALHQQWQHQRSPWIPILAIGSLLKIAIEWHSGTPLITQATWPPLPQAHLAGWLAGAILVILANYPHSHMANKQQPPRPPKRKQPRPSAEPRTNERTETLLPE